jgi:glycosyltransferase involved in cell wall biosynthesis/ribosomal protein S18 acetylase RimI-like enzyme
MATQETTNRVRVLHVVGDSRFGGIARIILGLGRVARAEGWQVDVLTTDATVQRLIRQEGMGVVDMDVIRREIRPLWDLAGLLRLQSFLRRESYRIVHTHTTKGGFVGRLAARLAHVPVTVHTAHGFAFHEGSPGRIRVFYSALERIAARCCDRVVSVSEFHRDWALALKMCTPADILAIPNGIASPGSSDPCASAAIRRQLSVPSCEPLILALSRLAADKGIEHLLEAAAILLNSKRRYRFMIAGDGPMRARLERLASDLGLSDVVTFLGFRQDVNDLLGACDLVVLPSLREGLSIVLLEAMAASKPIIATSIGSHREVASQADMACLVPPANPKKLAQAIQQFADDPPLMEHRGASARSLFESRYTEDRMLESYRQLYLDLLELKSPPAAISSNGHHAPPHSSHDSVVRRARADDLAAIVAIHQKAFSHFFLTRMGADFLYLYYKLVLNYRAGIVLVNEGSGCLDGFVCGFVDPVEFYRLMWRKKLQFALPAFSALARHPSLAAKVLYGVQRIQRSASHGLARSSELSSIAVAPEASGNGLGKTLVEAFLAKSWSMDAQCVYLTTDADGNDHANALYRETGFEHVRLFVQRKGRWMNEYVIHRGAKKECPL